MDRETAKQEIRQRISCTKYLQKSKSGLYNCPFCGSGTGHNATGALKLFPTNTWTCFACNKSGDIFDLYQQETGADFPTALSLLAAEAGISIDEYSPATNTPASAQADFNEQGQDNKAAANQSPTEAIETPTDYTEYYKRCRDNLSDPAAVEYLNSRGISLATAQAYFIGFDPQADPAGNPGGQGINKHPCQRIIIPTSKAHYVGRRIDGQAEFAKINSKGGSPGIFNLKALYAQDVQEVFVTEGAFDALSLLEIGQPAIATNSTENVDILLKRLENKRTTATMIVCLDNDEKGKVRTEKLTEGLRRLNISYITADICGQYKDPNEALTGDKEAFTAAANEAIRQARRTYMDSFFEKVQTEAYKPYETGIAFFDELLGGGVIQQSLLLLMAAPATGKTTLCQQIAEEMAARKKPVIYLNFEMSREQMIAKAISGRLSRKGKKKTAAEILQGYKWTAADKKVIESEINDYKQNIYPFIRYNPDNIGSNIEAITEYLHNVGEAAKEQDKQAPAIIIDYLHLITSEAGKDVQELIKQAMVTLKDYAMQYNTFVICIVATNRDSNKEGRLSMESGRDSSSIEYTGDYQITLNYYDIDNGTVKAKDQEAVSKLQMAEYRKMILRLHKNRLGISGKKATVFFNAAQNTFYGEYDFMPADLKEIEEAFGNNNFVDMTDDMV